VFRVCHVIVTVLGIILCPFNCRGDVRARELNRKAELQPGIVGACCPRCATRTDQTQPSNDQNDRDSESPCGCACVCKGALRSDHRPSVARVTDALHLSMAPRGVFDATTGTEALASWLSGGPLTSYPAGRSARLVHQSLLC